MPVGWVRVSMETQTQVNTRSSWWHSPRSTRDHRGHSWSTSHDGNDDDSRWLWCHGCHGNKEGQGLIERAKGRVTITAGLSVVHHAAWPDCLTSQGELEMDRLRQGESARRRRRRRRKMWGGGRKSGRRSRGCVHRSLSTVCWHGSYRTPFSWQRYHTSTVGVWHTPLYPSMHAAWCLCLSTKVKARPRSSSSGT